MRLANVDSRAVLLTSDDRGVDVESASGGEFGPCLAQIYDSWEGFRNWAEGNRDAGEVTQFSRAQLGCPSPAPRQIVAVGLNYGAHAAEAGFDVPDRFPPIFTKFVSSLAGPDCEVVLPPGGNTDWEVELVVVIGKMASLVDEAAAWDHVAGVTVGQDISERASQLSGPAPQFSLGKSFANFAPVGPWLVTPDSLRSRDDLELGCSVDGEVVQVGRTKDLIFSVSRLISGLSRTITLFPGDIIFTGTPPGVGHARDPQRFLRNGERLESWIEGIGELHQTFVSCKEG